MGGRNLTFQISARAIDLCCDSYAAASLAGKAVGGIGPVIAAIIIGLAGITPRTTPSTNRRKHQALASTGH